MSRPILKLIPFTDPQRDWATQSDISKLRKNPDYKNSRPYQLEQIATARALLIIESRINPLNGESRIREIKAKRELRSKGLSIPLIAKLISLPALKKFTKPLTHLANATAQTLKQLESDARSQYNQTEISTLETEIHTLKRRLKDLKRSAA
jgi:hypothetical protein